MTQDAVVDPHALYQAATARLENIGVEEDLVHLLSRPLVVYAASASREGLTVQEVETEIGLLFGEGRMSNLFLSDSARSHLRTLAQHYLQQ